MTNDEAKLEAERRWGGIAVARDRKEHWNLIPRYVVGVLANAEAKNMLVHGEGATWEEAFKDADARAEFLQPMMRVLRTVS
jgi:hypothetical protein